MDNRTKIYDVVVAGYLCVDLIPGFPSSASARSLDTLFRPGKLIEVDSLNFTLGGVVANTGVAMHVFSKRVCLNGLVGNDFLGRYVVDRLSSYGLHEGIQETDDAGTAFGLVLAPSGVDRIFLESPGCSSIFGIGHIDFDSIQQSRLFHFGYPPLLRQFYENSGNKLQELFRQVQSMHVLTSLDLSLPDLETVSAHVDWRQLLQNVIPYVDIFTPSLEELFFMMHPHYYHKLLDTAGHDFSEHVDIEMIESMASELLEWGAKIVLIKCGHKGAYLRTSLVSQLNHTHTGLKLSSSWDNRALWSEACAMDVSRFRNASGAGDTAVAAFLTAILEGETATRALGYAILAGRNSLYCDDIGQELDGWEPMHAEIELTTNNVVDLDKQKIK